MKDGRMTTRLGYIATLDEGAVVVYAETRGKARALAANEAGMTFSESLTSAEFDLSRFPEADEFAKKRNHPTNEDFRTLGFTDESGQRCCGCGLGDPSDGDNDKWALCEDCDNCGGCGCGAKCKKEVSK